ncbi:tyrosine-type recombinase/integrase [Marinomonas polaris]|uniref:tyrosine-type recombinase/integrase n=1 Tax=Marinomonas polaris TaxID=293552 RepID=UPI000934C33D|nr:tyrosine-type recombinase/integrase [Marinomonas polaris]
MNCSNFRERWLFIFYNNVSNILTLQKLLGHSGIKMTMRYSHLSSDFLEEATRLNLLSNIK